MNNVSDPQLPTREKKPLHVAVAILIGQLVINLPVILISLVVFAIGIVFLLVLNESFSSFPEWLFLLGVLALIIIGPLVGWVWWSFSVPRWRKWALQNGVPEDKLQKWAVITGLVWPKGSIFEKTEFRLKK